MAMEEMNRQITDQNNTQTMVSGLGSRGGGEMPSGGGGEDEPFSWTQTEEDMEVTVALPENTRAKDISVSIKRNSIEVKAKAGGAVLFEAPRLFQDIHPDESTWTVGSDGLVLTLEKSRPGTWMELTREE